MSYYKTLLGVNLLSANAKTLPTNAEVTKKTLHKSDNRLVNIGARRVTLRECGAPHVSDRGEEAGAAPTTMHQQLPRNLISSDGGSKFIRNFINIYKLCYPTGNDNPYLTKSTKQPVGRLAKILTKVNTLNETPNKTHNGKKFFSSTSIIKAKVVLDQTWRS